MNVGVLNGSLLLLRVTPDGPAACRSQQLALELIYWVIVRVVVGLYRFVLSQPDVLDVVDLLDLILHLFDQVVKLHDALEDLGTMPRVVGLVIGHHLLLELIALVDH